MDGFQEFEARRRKKFDKQIDSNVMISSKGLDEGIDLWNGLRLVETTCNGDISLVHLDELLDIAWNTGYFIHALYLISEISVWRSLCHYCIWFLFFLSLPKFAYKYAGL